MTTLAKRFVKVIKLFTTDDLILILYKPKKLKLLSKLHHLVVSKR